MYPPKPNKKDGIKYVCKIPDSTGVVIQLSENLLIAEEDYAVAEIEGFEAMDEFKNEIWLSD